MIDTYPDTRGRRLLLVDDDEAFNRVMSRALRLRGFNVLSAHSAAEAKPYVEPADRPSIEFALVDLNLGGASGLSLVPAIKIANPSARVVVLTGYASISTAVEAIKLGADQYLAKPVAVEAVVRALTDAEREPEEVPVDNTMTVSQVAWEHIQRVLAEHGGNISATARALGMHRRTLQRKLTKRPG